MWQRTGRGGTEKKGGKGSEEEPALVSQAVKACVSESSLIKPITPHWKLIKGMEKQLPSVGPFHLSKPAELGSWGMGSSSSRGQLEWRVEGTNFLETRQEQQVGG